MEQNPEETVVSTNQGPPAPNQGKASAGLSSTSMFEDCPCSGRNLDKFTAPAALLAIAEAGSASGYTIVARIRELPLAGATGVNHSAVYRALRKMEGTGMVVSSWQEGSGGPARRLYALTETGHRCLDTWAETLGRQSQAIEEFLEEYRALRGL